MPEETIPEEVKAAPARKTRRPRKAAAEAAPAAPEAAPAAPAAEQPKKARTRVRKAAPAAPAAEQATPEPERKPQAKPAPAPKPEPAAKPAAAPKPEPRAEAASKPETDPSGYPVPETVGGHEPQGNGHRKRRRRNRRGGDNAQPAAPALHPRVDAEELKRRAWKIYLGEVTEEGLALMDDRTAAEAARRAFRVAELFLIEAAHHAPAPEKEAPAAPGNEPS